MFSNDEFAAKINRTSKMIGVFAVVNMTIGLVLFVGMGYVAWHFISKIW